VSLKVAAVAGGPEVVATIKSLAEPLGCEVLIFADSQEAAVRLEGEKFDGIFLDIVLPRLDGFELAQRIRKSALNRETPIVMLTGENNVDALRQGFKSGATCFLTKPVSRERLATLIKAMRGPMATQRRRYPRLPLRATVKCKAGPRFDRDFVAGSSSISEGGMALGPSSGVGPGEEVELEFALPDAPEPVKARGRVLRTELTDRFAVEFINLADRDRKAIRRYVEGSASL
jgi:CheY-like chemotaxis protein